MADENALTKAAKESLQNEISSSEDMARLKENVAKGKVKADAPYEYADHLGNAATKAIENNLDGILNGDGYDAARTVLEMTYDDEAEFAAMVQEIFNGQAGMEMKGQIPPTNSNAASGLAHNISNAESKEDARNAMKAIKTFTAGAADDTIELNALFRQKAGARTVLRRSGAWRCCKWCQRLEGTFYYPEQPSDFFRRHENCSCVISSYGQKGHQTVYEGAGQAAEYRRIEETILSSQNGGAEETKTTERNQRKLREESEANLEKGIRSLNERIREHRRKISSPEEYCEGWDDFGETKQTGIIKHWQKEIRTFENDIKRREEELARRKL